MAPTPSWLDRRDGHRALAGLSLYQRSRILERRLLLRDEANALLNQGVEEEANGRVAEIFVSAVASGMRTLKMDGMEKILMGQTDLKQVRSVCIR